MNNADVGDDVYQEDPTVNQLEELAAKKIGKQAALFIPSGTMGNLIAVLTHCQRGEEIILEADSHIYYYEVGGISAVAGVIPRLIIGNKGILDPQDIKKALRDENLHYPKTTLICLENTHNRAGGTIISPKMVEKICQMDTYQFLPKLAEYNILGSPRPPSKVRLVTHYGISEDDIYTTIKAIKEIVKN